MSYPAHLISQIFSELKAHVSLKLARKAEAGDIEARARLITMITHPSQTAKERAAILKTLSYSQFFEIEGSLKKKVEAFARKMSLAEMLPYLQSFTRLGDECADIFVRHLHAKTLCFNFFSNLVLNQAPKPKAQEAEVSSSIFEESFELSKAQSAYGILTETIIEHFFKIINILRKQDSFMAIVAEPTNRVFALLELAKEQLAHSYIDSPNFMGLLFEINKDLPAILAAMFAVRHEGLSQWPTDLIAMVESYIISDLQEQSWEGKRGFVDRMDFKAFRNFMIQLGIETSTTETQNADLEEKEEEDSDCERPSLG